MLPAAGAAAASRDAWDDGRPTITIARHRRVYSFIITTTSSSVSVNTTHRLNENMEVAYILPLGLLVASDQTKLLFTVIAVEFVRARLGGYTLSLIRTADLKSVYTVWSL